MFAYGYFKSQPIETPTCIERVELPTPVPEERDLLVSVEAISVNPIDVKVRNRRDASGARPVILGWDAVGVVRAVGSAVTRFAVGERVWYAGELTRDGSNAELQLVDERIVSRAPRNLDPVDAVSMPLTSVTAWELLHDRLQFDAPAEGRKVLLVSGGSGGVGSMAIQLAARVHGAVIIASASTPEGAQWCRNMGAHHIVNHRAGPLSEQIRAQGIEEVSHVVSLSHTHLHFEDFIEILAPFGKLALIDDPSEPCNILSLKRKSLSLHYELMFTRTLYKTEDMSAQGALLGEVAAMVEQGTLLPTAALNLGPMSADSLREAHRRIEEGAKGVGKIVLTR